MLPIRKIVLYKHGVGYFERQGAVEGDATVELAFRSSEMNDVLKSLTVLDLSGGIVPSISYESTKPIEKQLEDIAISLPEQNALTGLLGQVKGAHAVVEAGSSRAEGLVMGTEQVPRQVDGQTLWSSYLCLLVDGGSLETFDLLELRRLTLSDPSLQKDLGHLLETLIASKKKDLKRLTIFARGEGERQLVASYVVETPVWKTSYRLLLPGEDEGEPLIQGWALVDNTQDEDWVDARLTLVAGLPVSFVHDLYSPRYKQRPVVKVQEEASYAPPLLEVGQRAEETRPTSQPPPPSAPRGASARSMAPAAPAAPAPVRSPSEARKQSVPVQTHTAEVGDLFQYEITNAITVKRNQSALVPILQEPFEGERVAVYNREVREANPMSAVLLKNTTGVTLEGGAVTVLEGEVYVGESMLTTLRPDEERLLPFSVELGCTVSIDHESHLEDVYLARIVRGTLNLFRYRVEETTYVAHNKLDRPIELFLEHRFRKGWKLVDTPEPVEKTKNFYRFRLTLPAKETVRFTVAEKGDEHESFSVRNMGRDQLELWVSRRYVTGTARAALERLMEINDRSRQLGSWIEQREREKKQIFENQSRLRENLKVLGTSPDEKGLRDRYVGQLASEEDRLREILAEVEGWQKERDALDTEGNTLVRGLSLEQRL